MAKHIKVENFQQLREENEKIPADNKEKITITMSKDMPSRIDWFPLKPNVTLKGSDK